jgi:hypothetical protein
MALQDCLHGAARGGKIRVCATTICKDRRAFALVTPKLLGAVLQPGPAGER